MPRVNTKSTVDQVQDCMKEESGWEGELSRWKNLREARNIFVKEKLLDIEQTATALKLTKGPDRQYHIYLLEEAFSSGFFKYSRTEPWMAEAVGESDAWIKVKGMTAWHIQSALSRLEFNEKAKTSVANPTADSQPVAVFDAVKDAVKNNSTK